MTPAQRRFVSAEGFSKLLQKSNGDLSAIDTASLAVLMPMPTAVKALGGADSRLIEFVITSDRVDRSQDVLSVDGWDFKDYEANPVVLFAHDHYTPPVGKGVSLSRSGNFIKSICEFTPKDVNEFGYMIYRMYAEKFMHAVSVGFQPVEYSYAADRKYGINYIKQSLLEYSAVPVPANPDAVATARSKGIDTAPLKLWAERVLDESTSEEKSLTDDARRRLEVLRAASSSAGRSLILELGDMKMTDAVKTPEVPASTVKKIETVKWECAMKHAHDTESEAVACDDFEKSVTAHVKSGEAIVALVKTGRALTPEMQTQLRSTHEALVPAPAKADDTDDTTEADEPGALEIHGDEEPVDDTEKGFLLPDGFTEEDLIAAVTSGTEDALKKVTGRVD